MDIHRLIGLALILFIVIPITAVATCISGLDWRDAAAIIVISECLLALIAIGLFILIRPPTCKP
jgi:hypothetical protein